MKHFKFRIWKTIQADVDVVAATAQEAREQAVTLANDLREGEVVETDYAELTPPLR